MYSLIMGASVEDTAMRKDRLFEYTEPSIKAAFEADLGRLKEMPALVMPELNDSTRKPTAFVGKIEKIFLSGRDCHYRFAPDPDIPPIPSSTIRDLASPLLIEDGKWGEFARTHWAVKDVDLYHALLAHQSSRKAVTPSVFTVSTAGPQADLISVMMPFDAGFTPVYSAISEAVAQHGWRCQRVDELFTNRAIIQDIVDLISTSRAVICDLSGRNANVFYEAGIAHALGRDVILLAQHESDVPFDLRHLRYISYVHNEQGLLELTKRVANHLVALVNHAS